MWGFCSVISCYGLGLLFPCCSMTSRSVRLIHVIQDGPCSFPAWEERRERGAHPALSRFNLEGAQTTFFHIPLGRISHPALLVSEKAEESIQSLCGSPCAQRKFLSLRKRTRIDLEKNKQSVPYSTYYCISVVACLKVCLSWFPWALQRKELFPHSDFPSTWVQRIIGVHSVVFVELLFLN